MKLAYRLTILFFLLAVLPTAVVGYLGYDIGKRIILKETIDHLVSINTLKDRELDRWIEYSKSSIEEMAQRPLVVQYASVMAASHKMQNSSYREAHRNIIDNHLKPRLNYGIFVELFLMCSPEGHISASTDGKQDGKYRNSRRYFIEGKKRTYVEGSYYSPTLEQPTMTISTPVKDQNGNTVAVLAGRFDLSELSNIMTVHGGKHKTLDTYLVNSFNFFVSEPRFGKNYILKKTVHTKGVDAGLSGKDGIGFYNDYRGEPVIGAYKWLPDFRMCIITEIDQSEAFAPVERLAWIIASSLLVILTIAVFMGMFFARTISLPLIRLAKGAQEIGSGNLEYKVGTASKDEIGELSREFDRMTQELKKTTVSRDDFSRERDFSDSVINSLPGVFYLFDEQGRFVRWNKNFEEVTGYSPEEISQMSPLDLFAGEDRQRVADKIKDVFIKGEDSIDAHFITKGGNKIPYFFTGIRINLGGRNYLIGVGIDIAERKKAEMNLIESENRYRVLFDQAAVSVAEVDIATGRFVRVNKRYCNMIGMTEEEMLNSGFQSVTHPDEIQIDLDNLSLLVSGKIQGYSRDKRYIRKDGTVIWGNLTVSPIIEPGKKLTHHISVIQDITERKKAEEEVARTASEWQSTFDSTNNAIWILDQDQRVLRSNKPAEQFFHRPCDEFIGKHCWEIVHGTAQPIPECPLLGARKSLCRETMEMQVGDDWFEVTVDPILDSAGRYAGAVHSITDITDRKQTEEKLKEQLNELRRWNEAVMGREMRNLDLKREVNELLVKAGLPARYASAEKDSDQ